MKSERKKLVDALDQVSKDIVRARDGNECQHCGRWCEGSGRHVSHVIPVSAGHSLRWEPLNMKVLCYHCHLNWWHKNPLEARDWFQKKFPDRYDYVMSHREIVKYSIPELKDLLAFLKETLSRCNFEI